MEKDETLPIVISRVHTASRFSKGALSWVTSIAVPSDAK